MVEGDEGGFRGEFLFPLADREDGGHALGAVRVHEIDKTLSRLLEQFARGVRALGNFDAVELVKKGEDKIIRFFCM